jgi:hypothetical protein
MAEHDAIRRVETLNLAILARHGTRGIDRARRRLEAVVADGVRAALGSVQLPEGPGVWLIDRMDLDFAVDPGMATAAIQRTVERVALRSLIAALQPGRSGLLYLPRYSAYVARFLVHLAHGEAWSRWEYERFAGLRALPTADALRTVLAGEPEEGAAALAGMAESDAAAIATALTSAGARRVLAAMSAHDAGLQPGVVLDLWRRWRARGGSAIRTYDLAHAALIILPAMLRLADGALTGSVTAASWLAAALDRAMPADGEPDGEAEIESWLAQARYSLAQVEGSGPMLARMLASWPRETVAAEVAAGAAPSIGTAGIDTPLAGLALLLPLIDEAAAALPADSQNEPAIVRLVLLMKCGGPALGLAAARDPVMRDLFGVPPAVRPKRAAAWLAGMPHECARAIAATARGLACRNGRSAILRPGDRRDLCFAPGLGGGTVGDRAMTLLAGAVMRAFARRLPGFGRSSARFLVANFLAGGGRIEATEDGVSVALRRPPLAVILAMTGFRQFQCRASWLAGRPLSIRMTS